MTCKVCNSERVVQVKAAGQGHEDDLAEYEPCPKCGQDQSPELLALKDIRATIETMYATPDAMDDPVWKIANAAIAKAEGPRL